MNARERKPVGLEIKAVGIEQEFFESDSDDAFFVAGQAGVSAHHDDFLNESSVFMRGRSILEFCHFGHFPKTGLLYPAGCCTEIEVGCGRYCRGGYGLGQTCDSTSRLELTTGTTPRIAIKIPKNRFPKPTPDSTIGIVSGG